LRLGRFFKNSINPEVWVWGAVGWAVGVLPVLVMRKIYLTSELLAISIKYFYADWSIATPTTAPSPSKTLQNALQKPNTLHALLVYQISAILLTLLHILMLYASTAELERDPKLTVFVRSRKHPYYLNGRFLFLLLAQMVSAGAFWVRNIMLDRFAFRSVLSVSHIYVYRNSSLIHKN
jgi:nucleoporin NDC1